MTLRFSLLSLTALLLLFVGCSGSKPAAEPRVDAKPAAPIGTPIQIKAALGLPPVPVPANNPPTRETVDLGRKLFFETKLSADNTISCASCHAPGNAFADPRQFSVGVGGKTGNRNAPPVLNAVYMPVQFWDGRAATLEAQASGPVANPVEMNQPPKITEETLNADPAYRALFEKAFGPGPITIEKITMAIASFERTLIAGDSPFDRYQFGGDKKALSPAAIRGLAIFKDANRGNCAVCHTIEEKHALFTDGKFHNLGVGMDSRGELKDLGRFNETKVETDKGAFKTPSLRNIAQSAPYMHDGSQKTLADVVDFYVGGGSSNPHLDKDLKELKLSGRDRTDLVAFLESLTGEVKDTTGPVAQVR